VSILRKGAVWRNCEKTCLFRRAVTARLHRVEHAASLALLPEVAWVSTRIPPPKQPQFEPLLRLCGRRWLGRCDIDRAGFNRSGIGWSSNGGRRTARLGEVVADHL